MGCNQIRTGNLLKGCTIVLFLLVFTASSSLLVASALISGSVVDDSSRIIDLDYDSATDSYADASLTNPNAFVEVCADSASDLNNKFIRIEYRLGSSGVPITILTPKIVSVDSSNCSTVDVDLSRAKALYPGLLSVGLSDTLSFSSADYFLINDSNGWMPGNYTISVESSGGLLNISVLSVVDNALNPITVDENFIVVAVLNAAGNVADSALTSINDPVLLSDPGVPRSYSINGIIITGDFTAPYIHSSSPTDLSTGVALTTPISFNIVDDTSVDSTSIDIFVDGVNLTANATITVISPDNVSVYLNASLFSFLYEQNVLVEALALDSLGNPMNDSFSFTLIAQPSSGGGGGGGGSGRCNSDWACDEWGSCIAGTKTRSCVDDEKCRIPTNIPVESIPCQCETAWSCTDWGECNEGEQSRFCSAVSICTSKPYWRPRETRVCEDLTPAELFIDVIMSDGESIYVRGDVGREIVSLPGQEIVLHVKLKSGTGKPLHNVIPSVDLPASLMLLSTSPERIDVLPAEAGIDVKIILESITGTFEPFKFKITARSDERMDSVYVSGKWAELIDPIMEEPTVTFNYMWLLLLLMLIPLTMLSFMHKVILADEFSARELMRYGVVGKRHVYVRPEVHDKYPGLPKFHRLPFSPRRAERASRIAEQFHISEDVAELLASSGKLKTTFLTPAALPEELKSRFKNINFVNPQKIKDVAEIREEEWLPRSVPGFIKSLENAFINLENRLSSKTYSGKGTAKISGEIESIKNAKTVKKLTSQESEELDKALRPIDRKLADIRSKLSWFTRKKR